MILSIESSCDDSSLALTRIEDAKLIAHFKISQEKHHSSYGGVVPEIASRLHAENLPLLLERVKISLNKDFSKLKAIAITNQPGLSVTLIEGLMMAKALS
ncbi:tRNA (adenosine(37)-N6)-threonylcarbamoyltransferase complex transferase subunit TsaD, partial [Helicobacter pylori]